MLDWLFGAGIGTNIGASLVWGLVAGAIGYWVRGHVKALHRRLDRLHASHLAIHRKLDALTSPPPPGHSSASTSECPGD